MAGSDDKFTPGSPPVNENTPGLSPSAGPGNRFSQPDDQFNTAALDDKIDAVPGVLLGNKIEAGDKLSIGDNVLFDPAAPIRSAMAEGKAFEKQDADAMKWLTKFLTEADTGFRVYHATARNEGHDYINTDQVGASFFQNVDKKKAPESYFSKDVTSGIYA